MAEKLRVAAYCRVSTDKDEQLNSLESQRKYFREYINAHDEWVLTEVYYDEGISGTQTAKRAGFNRMIHDATLGAIDLILTKEVSRFARNTVDTLSYTRKLKESGIGVIFTNDNIDTREPDGELRLTIMASIAQEESRKTSERVKWGQERSMEKGVVFGRDLLGYTVNDGKLLVNKDEVPVVRAIFHKYTNEGKGTHVIARELQEEGMRPKRMAVWSNTVILRVLRNEKYVGDLCQKKTITPNYLTHQKKYNRGEEKMICLNNHHEPIIDRDLWERTQTELSRRTTTAEQKAKHSNRYWCSGKFRCGVCQRRYVSKIKKRKDGSTYRSWRCLASVRNGALKQDADGNYVGCDNQSYNEQAILNAVKYCISHIQANFTDLKQEILDEIKAIQQNQEDHFDEDRIQKEIEDCYNRKRKVVDLLIRELITEQEAAEQKNWYSSQIESLEKQLQNFNETKLIRKRQAEDMEQYLTALDRIMDFIVPDDSVGDHSADNRSVSSYSASGNSVMISDGYAPKQLYREILDKIILYPENEIHIYLNCLPFAIRMKIRTSGRMEQYTTEVVEMNILEKLDEEY